MDSINIFGQIRRTLAGLMKTLSEEQLLFIPDGFDNNIAWNLGHVVYVEESLLYRNAGAPTLTNDTHAAMFAMNTSPTDWTSQPDLAEIRELLKATGMKLGEDYKAGVFANFKSYQTSTGFSVATIEESVSFVNFHEGLHLGTILSIRNLMS